MFGLRSATGISQGLVLLVVVVPALLFGSVLHALIPHSHDGGEIIWQELHAAIRHDTKAVVVLSSVFFSILVPLFVYVTLQPLVFTYSADALLTRGIHKYRKFR